MNKKIAILSLLIISAGLSSTALAYMSEPGNSINETVHEQLINAINNRDYNEWLRIREENNLPTRGRIFQVINEDNFDTFAKMHDAMTSGNTELANQYRAELGLGLRNGNGRMLRVHSDNI